MNKGSFQLAITDGSRVRTHLGILETLGVNSTTGITVKQWGTLFQKAKKGSDRSDTNGTDEIKDVYSNQHYERRKGGLRPDILNDTDAALGDGRSYPHLAWLVAPWHELIRHHIGDADHTKKAFKPP